MTTTDERPYARRYQEWIARARPHFAAGQTRDAFSGYPYVVNDAAPFTPLRRPLADLTLIPITSGGLYVPAGQVPFDAPNPEGDYTFRLLPTGPAQADLAVAHGHYDPADALADYNSVYPVDRLRELAAEGVIGALAPAGISFMGYATDAGRFAETTARAIAAEVAAAGAGAAFLVPV